MFSLKERLDDFSIREKNLWFGFCVDIAVAFYYYPRAFGLLLRGDGALNGEAMTSLIINTMLVAVGASVAISVLLHAKQKPEPRDERDRLIEARSNLWFSRVLVLGVLAVIAAIVLYQALPLTPLLIAHLLLFVLMLASMVNSGLKLLMYRLGS